MDERSLRFGAETSVFPSGLGCPNCLGALINANLRLAEVGVDKKKQEVSRCRV